MGRMRGAAKVNSGPDARYTPRRSKTFFPLVRHLSVYVTPLLARTPVSANQVTTISMIFGLGASWMVLQGEWASDVAGGALLVMCYILDNCDGEIARIKNQCTSFGMRYDSFVDFIVHVSFFASLGIGVSESTGQEIWFWMGWAAAAGGTINYAIGFYIDARDRNELGDKDAHDPTGRKAAEQPKMPGKIHEWVIYAFRELTRADFCFIVLGLALFDLTWILLPTGAIGAQVYWGALFIRGVNEYHV